MERKEFLERMKNVEIEKCSPKSAYNFMETYLVQDKGIDISEVPLHQKYVAIEEMSELTKEICKDLRGKKDDISILEEIADVTIMIKALRVIYNIDKKDLDKAISAKMSRIKKIN